MAFGVKYGPRDWYLTRENTERAIEALEKRKKINRKYDVPDLAGYSEDYKTLYIDKDCPETFSYAGKDYSVDKYLLLHEEVECSLMQSTGADYLDCHQIACCAEKEAVEMVCGMGGWDVYAKFCREWISKAWNKKNPQVPPDLNKKPYIQQKEWSKLRQMGYIK